MADDTYEVTWLVRRLFRAMADRADTYLRDSGLTAADRAVMEFLYPDARLSVPAIARRYQVSRQHVQVTANRLLDRGLLGSLDNPRHKRSPLLAMTERGRQLFERIRRRERRLLDELFADIGDADLAATRRTLQSLLDQLQEEPDHETTQ